MRPGRSSTSFATGTRTSPRCLHIELLTGCPAGSRQADGSFPEESVNGLVEKRLRDYAERVRLFVSTDGAASGGREATALSSRM